MGVRRSRGVHIGPAPTPRPPPPNATFPPPAARGGAKFQPDVVPFASMRANSSAVVAPRGFERYQSPRPPPPAFALAPAPFTPLPPVPRAPPPPVLVLPLMPAIPRPPPPPPAADAPAPTPRPRPPAPATSKAAVADRTEGRQRHDRGFKTHRRHAAGVRGRWGQRVEQLRCANLQHELLRRLGRSAERSAVPLPVDLDGVVGAGALHDPSAVYCQRMRSGPLEALLPPPTPQRVESAQTEPLTVSF